MNLGIFAQDLYSNSELKTFRAKRIMIFLLLPLLIPKIIKMEAGMSSSQSVGYCKKVDLWSHGIILYVLICQGLSGSIYSRRIPLWQRR
jgi:hypothetical protein